MKEIQANIETYDRYYAKPHWWFRWRYDTQVKRKTCLHLVKSLGRDWSGKTIFELGFGSGEVLFSFPTSCRLAGAELSPSATEHASDHAKRKKYADYDFFTIDGGRPLPLPDQAVDIVVASHVLEHVDDDVFWVREFYRILKAGGCLVVLVPVNERYPDPHHLRTYTLQSCMELCTGDGFRLMLGLENETLYHLVEWLYRRHRDGTWTVGGNIIRILFNLSAAPLPFSFYKFMDFVMMKLFRVPPRQAAILFIKE